MLIRGLFVLSVVLLGVGCQKTQQLVRRASPDLACPEEKVLVTRLKEDVYEARGCGRRRAYIYACNKKRQCGWIRHHPSEDFDTGKSADGTYYVGTTRSQMPEVKASDARVETGRSSSGSKQLKLFVESQQPKALFYVVATPGYDAERALLMWRVPKAEPAPDCTIRIVADGNPVAVDPQTKRFSRSDSLDYHTELPYASLAAMAQSSRVAARLCEQELVFSPAQLEKTRELMILVREEQAWKAPLPGSAPANTPQPPTAPSTATAQP